jgi:hypothetical protein
MPIIKVPEGITWKDFQEKYRKFFPISSISRRNEVMGREFKRLTGREPKDEVTEKARRQPRQRTNKEKGNS